MHYRAYIAASRRSDRSIEARLESARRASEIHRKRTGRSLRVTEEDVVNEEMYEEEDDDLVPHYRRFSALHPGLPYSAFEGRLGTYMSSQLSVRNYFAELTFSAKQSTAQQREVNNLLAQRQRQNTNAGFASQAAWAQNQMAQPGTTIRTESFTNSAPTQQQEYSPTFNAPVARAMSLSLPPHRRNAIKASPPPLSSGPGQIQPHQQLPLQQQVPLERPQSRESRTVSDYTDPISPTLPINQMQLLDGNPPLSNGVHSSQMLTGVPLPSTYHYQFDPDSKANNTPGSEQFAFGHPRDLSLTLAPQNMHTMRHSQNTSEMSMPSETALNQDLSGLHSFESFLVDSNEVNSVSGQPAPSGKETQESGSEETQGDTSWQDLFDWSSAS